MNLLKHFKNLEKKYKRIIRNIKISFLLGADLIAKLRIAIITFLLSKKKFFYQSENKIFEIKLRQMKRNFRIFISEENDIRALKVIFLDGEYEIDLKKQPEVIFDLGGHIGISALFFGVRYPHARIYVFEPDPRNFELLKRNIKDFHNIAVFPYAISNKNSCEKIFFYPNSRIATSLMQRLPEQDFLEVRCTKLDSIMEEFSIDRIDLLKFNIEGVEYKVFSSFRNLDKVRNLVGQVHFDIIECGRDEFLKIFEKYDVRIEEKSRTRGRVTAVQREHFQEKAF